MEWYEVSAALKHLHYANMNEWEQARLISFVTAQVQSTKKIQPEDIMKFPWDDDKKDVSPKDTVISKTDIERLQNMANDYLKQKHGKH